MTQANVVKWSTVKRKISELKEYSNNPRKIGKDEFGKLVESIQQDGYHMRLLINLDGTIIGGHSRKKALLKAGYTKDDEVEVLIPDRLLEGDDFDRINIRDNLSFGSWDSDILCSHFDAQQLIDWGMPPSVVGQSHYDIDSANEDGESKIKETKVKVCPHCGEILN